MTHNMSKDNPFVFNEPEKKCFKYNVIAKAWFSTTVKSHWETN